MVAVDGKEESSTLLSVHFEMKHFSLCYKLEKLLHERQKIADCRY